MMAPTPSTAAPAASKTYAPPSLAPLGSIAGLTAGNESGALDCLFGTDPGGFGTEPTPASCDATS